MAAPTTARRQIRQACVTALQAAVTANLFTATIQSPGDWNVPPEKLPAILLRTPTDNGRSGGKIEPNFRREVTLEIKAFAAGQTTDSAAQDQIEQLDAWIEQTLFTNAPLLALIEQVASDETVTDIRSDGAQHFAGVAKRIVFETFEDFEPTITPTLQEVTVSVVAEIATNAATVIGNNVLTFAAGAMPAKIVDSWIVTDKTNSGAIGAGTTVTGVTATTVTLSNPVQNPGVGLGDVIVFQPPNPTLDMDLPQ